MNATELYLKDGRTAGIFFCEKCRSVAPSQHLAAICCCDYICEECGKSTGSRTWLVCDTCRARKENEKEAARFEKAEKVKAADWGGWVFLDGVGRYGYFESVDDLLEEYSEDEPQPEYVWACKPHKIVNVDISDVTERIGEELEDFDIETLDGLPELKAAFAAFNEANKDRLSYEPDYTKAVVL